MQEIPLKYGCNPNQGTARVFMATSGESLPIGVLNGRAGYINLLDALNGWQLVCELAKATGLPAAASFKHVSPAGAAVGLPLTPELTKAYFTDNMDLSPLACAYARARGADRMSSFGDFAALSETVDLPTARLLSRETSDGVIAPGYDHEALEILKGKKDGNYCVITIDKGYSPPRLEQKTVFGITFEQKRNDAIIDASLLKNAVSRNRELPESAVRDLVIALTTLKYTQSNSVCYVKDGQAIGIGAGQQSRIHCTRLAGGKADNWFLRQHPALLGLSFHKSAKRVDRDNCIDQLLQDDADGIFCDERNWCAVLGKKPHILSSAEKREWLSQLTDVSLGSDAFFPFYDNVDRAHQSGVKYIAEAGGSLRDDQVIKACDGYGMVLIFTGLRLFHH